MGIIDPASFDRGVKVLSSNALERIVDNRGPALVANRLLAGSACGERRGARPLDSLVRLHE